MAARAQPALDWAQGQKQPALIVGAKCFVLRNDAGQIVEWECGSANLHDTVFHCALEAFDDKAIMLPEKGLKAKTGTPSCLKICERGAWNEPMLVETLFSLFTKVLHMKRLLNRVWSALRTRLGYTVAAFNLCTAWNGEIKLELAPFAL